MTAYLGVGMRGFRVDPDVGGDERVDRFSTEVSAPRPCGNRDMDSAPLRMYAQMFRPVEDDGSDIPVFKLIFFDYLKNSLSDGLFIDGKLEMKASCGIKKAPYMLIKPENGGTFGRLVKADTFKDSRTVVK
jgi:hypothetical protein